MLGLGIAGNAVAFSWIDALLLRPLPFEDADRLVDLDVAIPEWHLESASVHYADFDAWRRHQTTFEAMAVLRGHDFNLSGADHPEHVRGALATHDLFEVLALRPLLGRSFAASEDRPGGPNVVVLSHGLWHRRFGGGEDVLHRVIQLDGEAYTVIGVMPQRAGFPVAADLWVPLRADTVRWQGYSLASLGRLRPGVEQAVAQAELETIQQRRKAAGKLRHEVIPTVRSLHERYLGTAKPYLLALWIMVACVLSIACVNITGLLFIHALARRQEFGVRSSLGAGRFTILRHVFLECLVLAVLGGVLGWGLAVVGLRMLMSSIGDGIPFWATPTLDTRVLMFCAALCLGVAVLSGIAPYLRIVGKPVLELLGSAASSPGRRNHRLMRAMVGVEIALASTLIFGTSLLLHSFFELRRVDPGFRSENLLTFNLDLPPRSDRETVARFFEQLRGELAHLPGVHSASAVSALPLTGPSEALLLVEGSDLLEDPADAPDASGSGDPVVLHRVIAPQYFATMGISIARGRDFDDHDGRRSAPRVAMVNESFAQHYWPGRDAVGRRVKHRGDPSSEAWMTVVGVVHDILHDGLDQPSRPGIYVPMAQAPLNRMTLVVHSPVETQRLVEPIRDLVAAIDPQLPVFHFQTMRSRLEESLSVLRLVGKLAAVFMVVALVLALGGIYGSVSYAVSQRTRELAIRMAVGARPSEVRKLVVVSGARLVAAGVGGGIVLSAGLLQVLSAVLHGVESSGVRLLGLSAAGLVAVALVAASLPAWRASRVELARTLQRGGA